MSGKEGGIRGYWYLFTIHMGICRGPIDELVEVQVAERKAWPLAYTRTVQKETYTETDAATEGGGAGYGSTEWPPASPGDTGA